MKTALSNFMVSGINNHLPLICPHCSLLSDIPKLRAFKSPTGENQNTAKTLLSATLRLTLSRFKGDVVVSVLRILKACALAQCPVIVSTWSGYLCVSRALGIFGTVYCHH